MKTNKGFTLIELLSVIVVLAIIALIATPIILGVIEKAEKGAAEASSKGYIDAVEKQILINQMDNDATNDILDGGYTINGDNIVKGSTSIEVKVKGKPITGSFTISDGQVTTINLKVGKYIVGGNAKNNTIEVTIGGSSENNFVGASSLEAGLPIGQEVYINPETKLTCNSYTLEASNTNNKTGCMKWYVYKDNGNGTYGLLLDHNTTATVAWNSTDSNSSMKEAQDELNKLVSESHWDSSLNIDLIDAADIAAITGNNTFNVETASDSDSNWFYLDSNNQIQTTNSTTKSQYAWLFDYTYVCTNFGCNTADNSTYGYWTRNKVSGAIHLVWGISSHDRLFTRTASDIGYGVRPVITF